MEVILRQDVEKVGLRGEVVDVAPGFARNYLLPRKLAETATPAKVAELRKLEDKRARHEAQSFEQAQEIAQRLEASEIRFDVQAGETGTLFGSVTATDVAERVWEAQKVRIDRRKLDLPDSIKRIGRYQVPVELFADMKWITSCAIAASKESSGQGSASAQPCFSLAPGTRSAHAASSGEGSTPETWSAPTRRASSSVRTPEPQPTSSTRPSEGIPAKSANAGASGRE